MGDVVPVQKHPAGVGAEKPGDAVEQGRLAGAVGADERVHLPGFNVQGHAVHGVQGAEGLVETLYYERAGQSRLQNLSAMPAIPDGIKSTARTKASPKENCHARYIVVT